MFAVKLKKADANAATIVDFPQQPTWEELAFEVQETYHIPSERVVVAYLSGNDMVSVKDDRGLRNFFKFSYQPPGIAKFVVQDAEFPDASLTATWSKDSKLSDQPKSDHIYKLFCYVPGSGGPFQVDVALYPNPTVGDLKEIIGKTVTAADYTLVMWKLKDPMLIDPPKTLLERIRSKGTDYSLFADKLDNPSDLVSDIWPIQPAAKSIHVLVNLPVIASPGDNAQFLDIAQCIYDTLWMKPLDPFLRTSSTDVAGSITQYTYFAKTLIDATGLSRLRFPEDVLLVREEYTVAYGVLQSWSRKFRGGVVVTGQPGIGKMCFLYFILFQRLSAGLPTAFQVNPTRFFLFTSQGASVIPSDYLHPDKFPTGTWALSDSGEGIHQPCSAFLDSKMDVWVVQTSSPKSSRWKEWIKQRNAKVYVMDCISSLDMIALGVLLQLDVKRLMDQMQKWGPSARTCINLERGILKTDALSSQVAMAAKRFVANPSFITDMAQVLDFTDGVTHQLLTVRPNGKDREYTKVIIATRYLLGYVTRALSALDVVEQVKFYTMISSHPWLKGAAGWCFEKFVHVHLTSTPLQTTAAKEDSPDLVIPLCKEFHPLGRVTLLAKANSYQLPVYWRLTSMQFTSLDAIICTHHEILLLQTTISPKHGIKPEGIQDVLGRLPVKFRRNRRICLVFVTDTEQAAARLRRQHFSGLCSYPLHVYSSVITFSKLLGNRGVRETLNNLFDEDAIYSEIVADPQYEIEVNDEDQEQVGASSSSAGVSGGMGTKGKRKSEEGEAEDQEQVGASSSSPGIGGGMGAKRKRKSEEGEAENYNPQKRRSRRILRQG